MFKNVWFKSTWSIANTNASFFRRAILSFPKFSKFAIFCMASAKHLTISVWPLSAQKHSEEKLKILCEFRTCNNQGRFPIPQNSSKLFDENGKRGGTHLSNWEFRARGAPWGVFSHLQSARHRLNKISKRLKMKANRAVLAFQSSSPNFNKFAIYSFLSPSVLNLKKGPETSLWKSVEKEFGQKWPCESDSHKCAHGNWMTAWIQHKVEKLVVAEFATWTRRVFSTQNWVTQAVFLSTKTVYATLNPQINSFFQGNGQ